MDERIIKYCQGNLSKEEQDQLLKEAYKDPVLKSRIIDYQHLHSLLELTPERMDKEQGRINYACFRKLVNVQKRKVMLISFSRYAAIIVIAFVSAWMLASYYFSGNLAEQKELIAFQQELLVPAGQRAELTLPVSLSEPDTVPEKVQLLPTLKTGNKLLQTLAEDKHRYNHSPDNRTH